MSPSAVGIVAFATPLEQLATSRPTYDVAAGIKTKAAAGFGFVVP
jgi:hypothetical protein